MEFYKQYLVAQPDAPEAYAEYREALRDLEAAADPRPVFLYHMALTYHKLGNAPSREATMAEAIKRGLTKANLHPLEWGDYQKLLDAK